MSLKSDECRKVEKVERVEKRASPDFRTLQECDFVPIAPHLGNIGRMTVFAESAGMQRKIRVAR
jgi:hypothetical protein